MNNKIPKGYKKTEIDIIPEDWEVKKLGEVADFKQGVQVGLELQSKRKKPGFVLFIRIENYSQKSKDFRYIPKRLANNNFVSKDDIVIVRYGATAGFIGKGFEGVIANNLFKLIFKEKGYCLNYLYYYLLFNGFIFFQEEMIGGAMPALSFSIVSNFLIPLPPLAEQRAIARILSDFDALIESLDRLIEKKKAIKKGAMQELLTAKRRLPGFKGEWVRKRLGEIFEITRGYVLSVKEMSKSKVGKFQYPVYSSQTQNKGIIGYYDKYLFEDSITWTTDGANAGEVKFRRGKFYCTNVCGVLLNKEGYSNLCIAEIFNMVSRKYVSYVGNPKLMNNIVKNIELSLPLTLAEQKAIAQILSDMDAEIEALEKEKQKYEMMKKGAMELLLTGKVRIVDYELL